MTYTPRRQPRARQVEALAKIDGRRAFALRQAMRTGKSFVLVNDFGRLVTAGEAADLLMIAPGGVYRTWPGHLRIDLPDEVQRDLKIFVWDSGRARTKTYQAELAAFMTHRGPRALVVNVEAISSVKDARALCVQFLNQSPARNVAAIDESVVAKNPDSTCGKFIAEELAPLAAYRRILTGLITPHSPLDLWNQFRFLDPSILGHPSYVTFRARYARIKKVCMLPGAQLRGLLRGRLGLGGYLTRSELRVKALSLDPGLNTVSMPDREIREYLEMMAESLPRERTIDAITALGGYVQVVPVIEGFDNIEELTAMIEPYSYRCRLEDCYDMPESDWSFWDVDMHPEQRRVYDDLRRTATAELTSMDYVTPTHVVVRMLRLHQVLCGHVVDDDGKMHEVPERRTRALLDLVADYSGKAVVWCSYQYSVERVREALLKEYGGGSVACFWGGNIKTREEEEVKFKEDDKCRFMVGTPDAGGRGRDWSVADLCVYYSSRNNLDHRNQSEERLKAVGKMRPVAYVDLHVPGTVDDKIIDCLRNKIDLAAVIDNDGWRKWLV